MVKPAHIEINRDDYDEMIRRWGNDGVRPGAGELTRRMIANVDYLEYIVDSLTVELAELKKEVKNEH